MALSGRRRREGGRALFGARGEQALLALTAGLGIPVSGMAAPPTNADVGDADSFGKNAQWIGLAQTGVVILTDDCTPVPGDPPPGPNDRCVVLNGGGLPTEISCTDLGRIALPKDSTDNLICHWVTPIIFAVFG